MCVSVFVVRVKAKDSISYKYSNNEDFFLKSQGEAKTAQPFFTHTKGLHHYREFDIIAQNESQSIITQYVGVVIY